jgi:hypothetical protein
MREENNIGRRGLRQGPSPGVSDYGQPRRAASTATLSGVARLAGVKMR